MTRRYFPERPLPPYAYVPGRAPHPRRHPQGHSHGLAPEPLTSLDAFTETAAYRFSIDLFNHGYYWEAHEGWEELWRAAPRGSEVWVLTKGLIELAAAALKIRQGQPAAARRLAGAARKRLATLPGKVGGLVVEDILMLCDEVRGEPRAEAQVVTRPLMLHD